MVDLCNCVSCIHCELMAVGPSNVAQIVNPLSKAFTILQLASYTSIVTYGQCAPSVAHRQFQDDHFIIEVHYSKQSA